MIKVSYKDQRRLAPGLREGFVTVNKGDNVGFYLESGETPQQLAYKLLLAVDYYYFRPLYFFHDLSPQFCAQLHWLNEQGWQAFMASPRCRAISLKVAQPEVRDRRTKSREVLRFLIIMLPAQPPGGISA